MRARLSSQFAIAAGLLMAFLSSDAFAQNGQTASLAGTVKDASGAVLPEVTLTVSSPQLIGGPQQTQSDAEGRYRFASLLPGTYEITAALDRFKTLRQPGIELPPGLGLTLDFHLELAPVAEVVNVEAAAPAIDVHSSALPTLIGQRLLQNLPLDRPGDAYRGVYVNLAPGVTGQVAFGGAAYTNPFSLDGTDGNDPAFGFSGGSPNRNWIDEIQIVALGANAQYGEYTGARVNAITRSGSNRFSGLAEYWTTRSNWTGNNRGSLPPDLARQFRPIEVLERWETSEQVGGPIVRDRLWFFSGFGYYKDAERPPSFGNLPKTPDEPRKVIRAPQMLVKLTGAPVSRLRLEGYIEYGNSKATNLNVGPFVRPEAAMSVDGRQRMDNARLTWTLNDRTLVEARYGSYWVNGTSGPDDPSRRSGPPPHLDVFTGVFSANANTFVEGESRVRSASATLTRYADRVAGKSHEFKAGFEHEWTRHFQLFDRPGGIFYLDFNGAPNLALIGGNTTYRPSHRRTTVFTQDIWRVTDRLTIAPGLRAGFYDSSAQGPGPFYQNSSLSPRLGVAWDVAADHRTVVRAHYGRYHDPIITSFYQFLDAGAQATTIVARVIGPNQFAEVSHFNSGSTRDRIDPDAKHSYVEEYVTGVERELWPRLSVRAQYVRRSFKDSLGFVDVGPTWTPVGVIDPGPDGSLGTADDGPPLTVYYNDRPDEAVRVLTNPPGAWRHYNALQLIGMKRYSGGWEMQTSYTWSRTQGSINNSIPTTGDLGINGNWVNPNVALFNGGRTALDRTHELKVLGTYLLPHWGGVRVGGIYRYASGLPWARTADFGPLTNADGPIPVEPTGAHELPATHNADLRVEKTFRTGAGATVGMYFDAFNINNQGIAVAVSSRSGPNFGLPAFWIEPRLLRAGLRVTF